MLNPTILSEAEHHWCKKEKRQAVFDDDLPLSLYKTNSNISFQKGKGAIDYLLVSIWCPNFTACATVAATKATTTNVNITKTFLLINLLNYYLISLF